MFIYDFNVCFRVEFLKLKVSHVLYQLLDCTHSSQNNHLKLNLLSSADVCKVQLVSLPSVVVNTSGVNATDIEIFVEQV